MNVQDIQELSGYSFKLYGVDVVPSWEVSVPSEVVWEQQSAYI